MKAQKKANYYVGFSLAPQSTGESAIAILNNKLEVTRLDKLFTFDDIKHFFENFSSLKHSIICVSLPYDNSMLEGKWRLFSKPYTFFSDSVMVNRGDWLKRFSSRTSDFLGKIKNESLGMYRFEVALTRQALGLKSPYLMHSTHDCQFLQNALKMKFDLRELPSNMLSVAFLEAIVGALSAHKTDLGQSKKVGEAFGLDIILPS